MFTRGLIKSPVCHHGGRKENFQLITFVDRLSLVIRELSVYNDLDISCIAYLFREMRLNG